MGGKWGDSWRGPACKNNPNESENIKLFAMIMKKAGLSRSDLTQADSNIVDIRCRPHRHGVH